VVKNQKWSNRFFGTTNHSSGMVAFR
jgi:hypothetical protein